MCQHQISKEANKRFLSALRIESCKSARHGVPTAPRPSVCLSTREYGRNYVSIFAKFDVLCMSTHSNLSKIRQG